MYTYIPHKHAQDAKLTSPISFSPHVSTTHLSRYMIICQRWEMHWKYNMLTFCKLWTQILNHQTTYSQNREQLELCYPSVSWHTKWCKRSAWLVRRDEKLIRQTPVWYLCQPMHIFMPPLELKMPPLFFLPKHLAFDRAEQVTQPPK